MSAQSYLKKYWGHNSFRNPQEDIINTVVAGRDVLVLLPTGGGKSICFQIPALMTEGLCIVVSPLIALIKDQVEQLSGRGIKAAAIFAGMTSTEIDVTLDNCIYGDFKFLYVSPERLKSPLFLERTRKMKVSFLAIDEAHCISQWGYDFRPPYLEIVEFKNTLPNAITIALTASATKEVRRDIIEKLHLDNPKVFTASFRRSNLSYSVFKEEDKLRKTIEILNSVHGSSIVYCRNRKSTEEIAHKLSMNGIKSTFYHGGVNSDQRNKSQKNWIENKERVMVATNAFGMGIDKPDVRTVIHYDVPDNIEAYYQEAGRAGRDEKKAFAVLLYHEHDLDKQQQYIEDSFPSVEEMKHAYQCLANYFKLAIGSGYLIDYDFELSHFSSTYDMRTLQAYNVLKKLEGEGLIQLNENYHKAAKVKLNLSKEELYSFQISNENFDLLLKSLMRLYGGELFNNFVRLNFNHISQLTGTSASDIRGKLVYLDKLKCIDYIPSNQRPQLTFLTPRLDAKTLKIDKKLLEHRKQTAVSKLNQVRRYVKEQHTCRTRFIEAYFDELSALSCGTCDICVRRKKQEHFTGNVTAAKTRVLQYINELKAETIPNARQLMKTIELSEDVFAEATRQLIEEKKISIDFNGLISLIKPS